MPFVRSDNIICGISITPSQTFTRISTSLKGNDNQKISRMNTKQEANCQLLQMTGENWESK
jgi:hypothetical protein